MTNKKLKLAVSSLTNKIYAGTSKVEGIFDDNKQDVTEEAISCTAEHLFLAKQKLEFVIDGKTYELLVQEVK